ncbi:uncharacterized protein LOC116346278 [Contarinia nasturtii]|uniref:uncharacterized protein LOC116346278 n=1 Tax=Contarinia nasturtii TaxID=265458 RepID=UPI0012D39F36|nr:uncharacterized protein LOC116346278 [Contarinia nasturtii]
MELFYRLAFVLIFFAGIINQSEGGNVFGIISTPVIEPEVNANQSHLPYELIDEILIRAGFETTKNAAHAKMRSGEAIKRIFANRTIRLIPHQYDKVTDCEREGDVCLLIEDHERTMKLFRYFGEHVRRIDVNYVSVDDHVCHDINENIIKKYAKQLTELKLYTPWELSQECWQDISNENGEIHFPEMKKFEYDGRITKNPFDVHSIFPKLEIFKLEGEVDDINCLANVRHLKELSLDTEESLGEDQLVHIIANNKQLTKLSLSGQHTIRTIRSIDKHLKNLKTLNVNNVGKEFYAPPTNKVYNFTSVTSFSATVKGLDELYGDIPFDMPNLENLDLDSGRDILSNTWFDHRITNFINRFHKLETVFLEGLIEDSYMNCIESLTHVKEFGAIIFGEIQLSSLTVFFENFDKTKSNLKTIKIFNFDDFEYPLYKKKMDKINNHLEESMKPTWQISCEHGKQWNTYTPYYLKFERDP